MRFTINLKPLLKNLNELPLYLLAYENGILKFPTVFACSTCALLFYNVKNVKNIPRENTQRVFLLAIGGTILIKATMNYIFSLFA